MRSAVADMKEVTGISAGKPGVRGNVAMEIGILRVGLDGDCRIDEDRKDSSRISQPDRVEL